MQTNRNRKMKQDSNTNLPPEIMIDILSRLPIQTTINCKLVCKSWLDLVESLEFAKSHFSKSISHFVVFQGSKCSMPYNIYEFVDEVDRCKIVFNFSFPHPGVILGSANGLLFLCNRGKSSPHYNYIVCNPITREYIELPPPSESLLLIFASGIGVSKITGKYKLVRILHEYKSSALAQCEFQFHTLGTGTWRSIAVGNQLEYSSASTGASVDGNLHWLAFGSKYARISCFDLDTELVTSFPAPLTRLYFHHYNSLSAVGNRLCLCNSSIGEIVIWLMNEYGDEKSWTKGFIISKTFPCELYGVLFPINVFKDGDILIALQLSSEIFCYSKKSNAFRKTAIHKSDTSAVIYTPSFLPLKTLEMENVSSIDIQSF